MSRKPHGLALVLRDVRRSRGWSQREVAQRAGVAQSSIANYETGLTHPNLPVLDAWAQALGCSLLLFPEEPSNAS